ncbi:hypothetical protein COCNU_scaffold002139G000010 [Cocos nucifera]|nr:hypothetical protein [Cocos nucifera]
MPSFRKGLMVLFPQFDKKGLLKEMDIDVVERLTKDLYAQKKRKGAAQGGSLKRAKVDSPSFEVLDVPMAAPEVVQGIESGYHILAHLKRTNHQKAKALKVQGDPQAKIDCLQGKVIEAEHLTEEKAVENESLQGALQNEELISIGLKATLILEEEKKKEAEIKVVELDVRTSKLILEVAAQAMEEFKISFEMKDLNIAFG